MSHINDVRTKGTPIVLGDGVTRTLKYTLNALAELEERYGTVDEAFKALDAGSIKAIRFVIWAGLIDSDETITEKQVGSLLDLGNLATITESITAAMNNDIPDSDTPDNDATGDSPNPTMPV